MVTCSSKERLRKTAVAILVFYILALCMNGEALLRNAELMPYGRFRDTMVVLVQPFAWIARNGPGWLRERVSEKQDKYWEGVS